MRIFDFKIICKIISNFKINSNFFIQYLIIYLSSTFYDDHTTSLVLAMLVGSYTAIFAAVLRFAVNDLHRDNSVGVTHRIVILGELFPILVPFHGGRWVTAQTAEQFACLSDLDDTWSQQEGEAWRRFDHLQPHIVAEWFASAYRM